MSYQRELEVAKQAARAAAEVILKHYQAKVAVDVTHKGPHQPVTIADLEANKIIFDILTKAFPDDAWLSEEDIDSGERFTKKRVWIVDPLDGTQEFINKNPEFAVSIGLVESGSPVVGVICNPATNELFFGARGEGVFLQTGDLPIVNLAVTQNQNLSKVKLIASKAETRRGEWERFKDHFHVTPTGGSAYKLALVAAGRTDGCFTLRRKSEWDVCAGHCLVVEAGGVVTSADGAQLIYNQPKPVFDNLVYCNKFVHQYILGKIGAP